MDLMAGLARLFFFALNMVVNYSSGPIATFMCPPTPSLLLPTSLSRSWSWPWSWWPPLLSWSVSFFMKGALRLLHHPPKLPVQEPTGKANILIKTSLGLQSKICRINIFKFSNQRDCAAGQHRVPVVLESLVPQEHWHFLSNFTSSPEFIIVMCQHFFNHNFCEHT